MFALFYHGNIVVLVEGVHADNAFLLLELHLMLVVENLILLVEKFRVNASSFEIFQSIKIVLLLSLIKQFQKSS